MPSPERPLPPTNQPSKVELLIELSIIEERIKPYLETALALDEVEHLDRLLEERNWILDDLAKFV